MSGFLDQFRGKIVSSVRKEPGQDAEAVVLNDRIALGVLLWIVAEADDKFLPEERGKIEEVLKEYGHVPEGEMPFVMKAVDQAARERIDMYSFTREVSEDLSYDVKKSIIENLFRIACVDKDLAHEEEETIRKISGLFGLDHKDFIDAKIRVKKEFGIETVM